MPSTCSPPPPPCPGLLAAAAALSGSARPLPLAVPMAGRGPLESRLRAVLSSRPRRALSRPRAAFAFVLALFVLVPLAALRPAARAALRVDPLLPHAPVLTPAPPKSIRHFPAPVKAAVAAPPALTPAQSIPIGVPPMKTLTPAKTVALAALAATLTLPAAQAKPTAPVKHAPSSAVALPHMSLQAAPPPHDNSTQINFATQGDVTNGVGMLFQGSHRSYVIEPGVSGSVKLDLHAVPFDKALSTLVGANSEPLTWTIEDGIYHIRPRAATSSAKEAQASAPCQVQLKFEWVASAGAAGAAPDKTLDALTIIAEEGRKAQVSSRHLQNGAGGEETISVLPHFEPGGVVVLDITERSDSTARTGGTKSNSAETTVRVKTGETGTVRVQVSREGGQGAERVLFVTPTIIGVGGG